MSIRRFCLLVLLAVPLGTAGVLGTMRPSSERSWTEEHAVVPAVEVDGARVRLHRIRNFGYRARAQYQPAYYVASLDLDQLQSAWLVLTLFSEDWRGPAHSFVSFGFADGRYLAISVEARREVDEQYSLLAGLFRQYELIYVIGDERDLIGQRAAFEENPVYLYPIRAPVARIREVLVQMLQRADKLRSHPEFYNTLTNNCSSNLIRHVNAVVPGAVPGGLKTLLPGYADEVALNLGLIDTELEMEQARAQFRINERARAYLTDPRFSARIRNSGSATPE